MKSASEAGTVVIARREAMIASICGGISARSAVRRRLAAMVIEAVEARPHWLDLGVVADEGLIEHLRNGQPVSLCQRMTLGRHEGAWLGPERLDANPRIGRRWVTERYVHLLKPG